MKKKILIIVKFSVAAAVLWWVSHKLGAQGRRELVEAVRDAQLPWLVAGIGLLLGVAAICIVRWKMLLDIQGIHLTVYQVAWTTSVGMFFNAFLIGATGGDVLKAWYITQASSDRKPHALLSIVVDRIIGLLGLFVLANIAVLTHLTPLLNHPKTRPIVYTVIASLFVFIVALILSAQRHWIVSQPWWGKIWERVPFKEIFRKLSESYDIYEKHPRILALALVMSVGVHLTAAVATWCMGRGVGVETMNLEHYVIYCPIINAISAVPITPGGVGIREGAFKFFLGIEGVPGPQAVAVSLLYYGATLFLSLIAGGLYLIGKPKGWVDKPTETINGRPRHGK